MKEQVPAAMPCVVRPVVFERLVVIAERQGLSAEDAKAARASGEMGGIVRGEAIEPVAEEKVNTSWSFYHPSLKRPVVVSRYGNHFCVFKTIRTKEIHLEPGWYEVGTLRKVADITAPLSDFMELAP